jgi:hypothetical protein
MPFREKNAWITVAALIVVYGVYFGQLIASERLAGPASIGLLVAAVIALIVIMTASHIALAIAWPTEAQAPADEREKTIELKAERLASYVLSTAVVCLIGALLVGWSGLLVANLLLAAMVLAELVKAATQIAHFRAGA